MNIGEFDKKHFSLVKGGLTATAHALKYLVIPYVLFAVGLMVLAGQDGQGDHLLPGSRRGPGRQAVQGEHRLVHGRSQGPPCADARWHG